MPFQFWRIIKYVAITHTSSLKRARIQTCKLQIAIHHFNQSLNTVQIYKLLYVCRFLQVAVEYRENLAENKISAIHDIYTQLCHSVLSYIIFQSVTYYRVYLFIISIIFTSHVWITYSPLSLAKIIIFHEHSNQFALVITCLWGKSGRRCLCLVADGMWPPTPLPQRNTIQIFVEKFVISFQLKRYRTNVLTTIIFFGPTKGDSTIGNCIYM